MSGSGIDWSAVARAAAAANAIPKGGLFGGLGSVVPAPAQSVSSDHPYGQGTGVYTQTDLLPGANGGDASLLGPLKLPVNVKPDDRFTWSIDTSTPGANRLTQMTLAGSLSWLRDLAAHNQSQYNDIVAGLVRAGYLSPADARYGSYTSTVATKFLQSAIDVEQANNDAGAGGAVKTWWNHIDELFNWRAASGQINSDGSAVSGSGSGSGSGSKPVATRTDVYTNPDDVKAAINNAARSILGRHLTDAEAAQFAKAFHGQEQTYNDQRYAQQVANVNNQASAPAAVQPPSPSAAAQNYVDTAGGSVGDDRTKQLLGSYIGVLRNMVGLGSGGVSSAVS